MLKSWLSRCSLIFFSCSYLTLSFAYSEPTNDPLQAYRDAIKRAESKASQATLDDLKANAELENTTQQNKPTAPSAAAPTPRSNNDKAFIPDNTSVNPKHSSDKNPWLQSNPWAKQPPNIWEKNAKVNPYANAPIPGPTAPNNVSANAAIPSPPNIFAPNTNKPQANANS